MVSLAEHKDTGLSVFITKKSFIFCSTKFQPAHQELWQTGAERNAMKGSERAATSWASTYPHIHNLCNRNPVSPLLPSTCLSAARWANSWRDVNWVRLQTQMSSASRPLSVCSSQLWWIFQHLFNHRLPVLMNSIFPRPQWLLTSCSDIMCYEGHGKACLVPSPTLVQQICGIAWVTLHVGCQNLQAAVCSLTSAQSRTVQCLLLLLLNEKPNGR